LSLVPQQKPFPVLLDFRRLEPIHVLDHIGPFEVMSSPLKRNRPVNRIFNPFARVVNMGRCPAITGAPSWPTPSANAIGQ
jgi:hypothetical protein